MSQALSTKISIKQFSEEEKKEIVFKEVIDDKLHHTTILNSTVEPKLSKRRRIFCAKDNERNSRLLGATIYFLAK